MVDVSSMPYAKAMRNKVRTQLDVLETLIEDGIEFRTMHRVFNEWLEKHYDAAIVKRAETKKWYFLTEHHKIRSQPYATFHEAMLGVLDAVVKTPMA